MRLFSISSNNIIGSRKKNLKSKFLPADFLEISLIFF